MTSTLTIKTRLTNYKQGSYTESKAPPYGQKQTHLTRKLLGIETMETRGSPTRENTIMLQEKINKLKATVKSSKLLIRDLQSRVESLENNRSNDIKKTVLWYLKYGVRSERSEPETSSDSLKRSNGEAQSSARIHIRKSSEIYS